MNTLNTTPGAWHFSECGDNAWIIDENENYLCEAVNEDEEGHFIKDASERFANLRVMAAASDLFEALEQIRKWWMEQPQFLEGNDEMPAEIFDDMQAALRKAKGA